MGKDQAKFFLVMIVTNFIMVPIITTPTVTTNDFNTAMSPWDDEVAARSHVDICCGVVLHI